MTNDPQRVSDHLLDRSDSAWRSLPERRRGWSPSHSKAVYDSPIDQRFLWVFKVYARLPLSVPPPNCVNASAIPSYCAGEPFSCTASLALGARLHYNHLASVYPLELPPLWSQRVVKADRPKQSTATVPRISYAPSSSPAPRSVMTWW